MPSTVLHPGDDDPSSDSVIVLDIDSFIRSGPHIGNDVGVRCFFHIKDTDRLIGKSIGFIRMNDHMHLLIDQEGITVLRHVRFIDDIDKHINKDVRSNDALQFTICADSLRDRDDRFFRIGIHIRQGVIDLIRFCSHRIPVTFMREIHCSVSDEV